jgi:hypothetical protein
MKRVFLLTFVAVFLLQGILWACFSPSSKTVITAVPMACCAKSCQKTNSQEEAQTACNTTALQANSNRVIKTDASTNTTFVGSATYSHQPSQSLALAYAPKNNNNFQHRRSLPLYLTSHAFLI